MPENMKCYQEGKVEVISYCWDGKVKKYRICRDGHWAYIELGCLPQPENYCPTEGETKDVVHCWDGTTVKSHTKCVNHLWVEETFDCPEEPECDTEGDVVILEYCWDNSAKRIKTCTNGKWVESTLTCPDEPECYQDELEILEYCWDNSVKKQRFRKCVDGKFKAWVEETFDCPDEPPSYAEWTQEKLDVAASKTDHYIERDRLAALLNPLELAWIAEKARLTQEALAEISRLEALIANPYDYLTDAQIKKIEQKIEAAEWIFSIAMAGITKWALHRF